ncbi:MAG: ABC transporter ATP-binding protein [bacterium]
MILEAENISFSYRERVALRDVCFTVDNTELLGIIGPNGSGKTTLVKNITGILKTQGEVFFNHQNECLRDLSRKQIAQKIGVVPQKSELRGNFTVQEVIEMGRYSYRTRFKNSDQEGKIIIENILEKLNLLEFKERKIQELSGGEFQKVLVARALAQEPEILIFDEATSHLDINHSIEIFKLAKKLIREQEITVIAIIHDLNLAAQFCDRIMVLKDGEKCAIGRPDEVITQNMLAEIFQLKEAQVYLNPANQKPYIIPVA